MSALIHIGLGKCATTSLQRYVFPQIAAERGLSYLDARQITVQQLRAAVNTGAAAPGTLPRDCLLSCEGLLGWNPRDWARRTAWLAAHLPQDAHILLTLRNPRDYAYSTYVQRCLHGGDLIAPDAFFKRAGEVAAHPFFCMDSFDITGLIADLNRCFTHVSCVRFEDILAGGILGHRFTLPKVQNKSLGQFSYTALNALERARVPMPSSAKARAVNDARLLDGQKPLRTRNPLRRVLGWLDNGTRIAAVHEALAQFPDVLARETQSYARLADRAAA